MFNMILKLSHYLCVWRKSWIFVGYGKKMFSKIVSLFVRDSCDDMQK